MSQAERLTGRSSQPKKPKVGARKTINGKKMMWNGSKWVAAPNHSRSSTSGGSQATRITGGSATPKPKPKKKTGNTVTGQANYTRQQQRLSDARSNPRYSRKPAATKPTTTKPTTTKPPASKPPASKPPAKKSTVSTYKKHGSDLHIGRHKTLAEHRKAVADRKKKKKTQSNANNAGWQGNRNY